MTAVNKTHINETLNTSTVPEDINASHALNDSIIRDANETIGSRGKARMIGNYTLGKTLYV